jgi:hypothetical protein
VCWTIGTAAAAGQLDVMQPLITSRPDAASPGLYNNPLCEAAAADQVQAMQLLLQHGADINGTPGTPWSDSGHVRPHLCAISAGCAPFTIQWMLEQGADAGQLYM